MRQRVTVRVRVRVKVRVRSRLGSTDRVQKLSFFDQDEMMYSFCVT